MKLLDYITESGFLPHIKCDSVEDAVTRLVDRLEAAGKVQHGAELVAEVMRREAETCTAIGGGLVIPHARWRGVSGVQVAVATLAEPLDIMSEDGQPVDIVILLAGTDEDPRLMLRVLARLARLVRNGAFLDLLRQAPDASTLYQTFSQADDNI